jgi:peptidoglycan LD-endopeptidase CwlK
MDVTKPNKDLIFVNSKLKVMVNKLLAQTKDIDGWSTFVVEGYRSNERQAWLYAQGRTRAGKIVTYAKPGQSDHNTGKAVDIAFQSHGKASWDPKLYAKIVPIAKAIGLKWGGDFPGFKDMPHFYI